LRAGHQPVTATSLLGPNTPVGAAEGCDLLILKTKVKESQPSAAPTQKRCDSGVTGFYSPTPGVCAVSQDCATQRQESTNGILRPAINL
jgi:hypothetical protein